MLRFLHLITNRDAFINEPIHIATYLDGIKINTARSALARDRCGSHNLYVRTGAWIKLSREERLRRFCEEKAKEDVLHIALNCTLQLPRINLW